MSIRKRSAKVCRRGAAAVEFAFVAPIFVTIMMGVAQASQLFDAQNQLAIAVRDGARLAGMDRSGVVADGQTTNSKIANDIVNFLNASGLPGDQVDVFIVDPHDHTTPFDLDAPSNDLELFEVRVELPYSALTDITVGGSNDNGEWRLSSKIVFRNARAAIVQ